MKIGIDMDDTICCTTEEVDKYELVYLKENNLTSEELWSVKENREKFLYQFIEDIWKDVSLKDGVVDILRELKKDNELYIVTARTNKYVDDILNITNNYLNKNNIMVDGIFVEAGDKVDVCVNNGIDKMIDDSRFIYERLTSNGIDVILFDDKRRNLDITNRVDNWNDILKYFKK